MSVDAKRCRLGAIWVQFAPKEKAGNIEVPGLSYLKLSMYRLLILSHRATSDQSQQQNQPHSGFHRFGLPQCHPFRDTVLSRCAAASYAIGPLHAHAPWVL
jgi:hypothetical protein